MSLLGNIEKSVIGNLNLVGLVEEQGVSAVEKLIEPHVKLDDAERAKNAKRLRDAAACLEANPPKIAGAVTDVLQFVADCID